MRTRHQCLLDKLEEARQVAIRNNVEQAIIILPKGEKFVIMRQGLDHTQTISLCEIVKQTSLDIIFGRIKET